MTREEIQDVAWRAGFPYKDVHSLRIEELERFARLVLDQERHAILGLISAIIPMATKEIDPYQWRLRAAIHARSAEGGNRG